MNEDVVLALRDMLDELRLIRQAMERAHPPPKPPEPPRTFVTSRTW